MVELGILQKILTIYATIFWYYEQTLQRLLVTYSCLNYLYWSYCKQFALYPMDILLYQSVSQGRTGRFFVGILLYEWGSCLVWSSIFLNYQVLGHGSTKSLRILGGGGCCKEIGRLGLGCYASPAFLASPPLLWIRVCLTFAFWKHIISTTLL